MNAMKNAVHGLIILAWLAVGAVFTFKSLALGALLPIACFWAWVAGYGGFTTWLVSQFKSAPAALGVHAVTLFALSILPRVVPFSVLRYGLDVLC